MRADVVWMVVTFTFVRSLLNTSELATANFEKKVTYASVSLRICVMG